MALITRGSRGRKLLTLGLLLAPWFLKDHLATAMEERSTEAQQVLLEESSQEQREEQAAEQRQLMDRLARIELRQVQASGELSEAQVAKAVADDLSRSFSAEGKALQHSTRKFEELLPKVAMDAATQQALAAKVHQVEAVAQALEAFKPEAAHPDNQALLDQWSHAEVTLGDAYEQLSHEAVRDRDASTRLALWSRIAAWSLTAIAALMAGDWTSLFGGGAPEA